MAILKYRCARSKPHSLRMFCAPRPLMSRFFVIDVVTHPIIILISREKFVWRFYFHVIWWTRFVFTWWNLRFVMFLKRIFLVWRATSLTKWRSLANVSQAWWRRKHFCYLIGCRVALHWGEADCISYTAPSTRAMSLVYLHMLTTFLL